MTTASHNPPQYNGFGQQLQRQAGRRGDRPERESASTRRWWTGRSQRTGGREQRTCGRRTPGTSAHSSTAGRSEHQGRHRRQQRHGWHDGADGLRQEGPLGPGCGIEIIELNFDNSKGEFARAGTRWWPRTRPAAGACEGREGLTRAFCFDGDADRCDRRREGHIVGCDHLTAVLCRTSSRSAAWRRHRQGGGSTTCPTKVERDPAATRLHRSRGQYPFMKALAEHGCVSAANSHLSLLPATTSTPTQRDRDGGRAQPAQALG